MGKDRYHGTDLINLYPGRRSKLMEPRAVQRYSHTPGTQKTIRQTGLFLHLFILQVMPETGEYSTGVGVNPPTEAPQVSVVVQVATAAPSVPVNILTGTLQGILGFTITQVRVLVDYGYSNMR